MTFKEIRKMFRDKDNWRLIPNDSAATAIYKEKYLTYLRFSVTIYSFYGHKIIHDFSLFEFNVIKLFYRRPLRKYLERKIKNENL